MIKPQKTGWLAIISSLILAALLLAACSADKPAQTTPADTASAETESNKAGDGTSEEVEIVSDINEVFGEPSGNSNTGSTTTDAAPADTEVDANGISIGFTENGNPYRGNPNAPVVIEEFSDFQ